jgi:hypothetical protein
MLKFVQPRPGSEAHPFVTCFEYRTDGDTSQILAENGGVNYNPPATDGLYPFYCLAHPPGVYAWAYGDTLTETVHAMHYVEIRMVFGGETDERFDWTRFDVLPLQAADLKQDTLAQASALLVGATKADSGKLSDVVKQLTDPLAPSRWIDGNHVVAGKRSSEVFDREKAAVVKLMDLVAHGSIPVATTQGMIDMLVQADQLLAETALADAIAAGGDPAKIAESQKELEKAAAESAKGHFDRAIDHYKNAWQKAQDAMR